MYEAETLVRRYKTTTTMVSTTHARTYTHGREGKGKGTKREMRDEERRKSKRANGTGLCEKSECPKRAHTQRNRVLYCTVYTVYTLHTLYYTRSVTLSPFLSLICIYIRVHTYRLLTAYTVP